MPPELIIPLLIWLIIAGVCFQLGRGLGEVTVIALHHLWTGLNARWRAWRALRRYGRERRRKKVDFKFDKASMFPTTFTCGALKVLPQGSAYYGVRCKLEAGHAGEHSFPITTTEIGAMTVEIGADWAKKEIPLGVAAYMRAEEDAILSRERPQNYREQCKASNPEPEIYIRCVLKSGHTGKHLGTDNSEWPTDTLNHRLSDDEG